MICKQSPSIASVTAIRFCLLVFTETFSFRKGHCFCCCLLEIQRSNLFISLLKVSACIFAAGFLSPVLPCKSPLSNEIKWFLKQSLILEIRIWAVIVCNTTESVMPVHSGKFCQIHCMLAEMENKPTFSACFYLHVLSSSVFSQEKTLECHTRNAVCKLSGQLSC